MKKVFLFLLISACTLSSCIIKNENTAIASGGGNSGGEGSGNIVYVEDEQEDYYEAPSNSMQRYSGKIGSYPVTMFINPSITSGNIGYYYYNKYKKEIALYVDDYDRDGDGTVEISLVEETAGHGSTGYFHIAVYPSHSIRGSFVNSKGQYFDVNLN